MISDAMNFFLNIVTKQLFFHSKNKTPFLVNAIPVLGIERILVTFQDRPVFKPNHLKGLAESFPLMWLNTGIS